MKSSILKFFIFSISCHIAYAADIATPIFWERSFYMNISNPNAVGYLVTSSSYMISSLDFQGLNVEADRENVVKKIVFNFGDCCTSSNTTMEKLEEWNSNSLRASAINTAQQLALVKRGGCSWSEKVSVVNNLALLNNLNVTAIFIYDNETYTDIQISATFITGSGSAGPSGSASSLPASRSVLNMADNDLKTFTVYPTIYFVPNAYGQTLLSHISTMYNASTPYLRYYWLITPYFDEVTWGDSVNFFSTSKGYIAYIIILAVVFIIAFVFLRWWRIRRRRAAYNEGFRDGVGIHMQVRPNQIDPLPVDIVNRLPISKYSENLVKNVNCAICLEDFVPGNQDIRLLPCGHGFCVLCIDPWLTQKSTLCPICKWDCLPSDLRLEREAQNTETEQQQQQEQQQQSQQQQLENNRPPSIHTETHESTPPTEMLATNVPIHPSSSPAKVEVNEVETTISMHKEPGIPENPFSQASSSSSIHSNSHSLAIDMPHQEEKKG